MKKIFLILISIILLIIPVFVNAEDEYIFIDDYHIDVLWDKDTNNIEVKETYTFNKDYENVNLTINPYYSGVYETNFIREPSDEAKIVLNKIEKGEYYISYLMYSNAYDSTNCYSMKLIDTDSKIKYNNISYLAMEKNENSFGKRLYVKEGSLFDNTKEDKYLKGKSKDVEIDDPHLEICGVKENNDYQITSFFTINIIVSTIISIVIGILVIVLNRNIINKCKLKELSKKEKNKQVLLMCILIYIPVLIFTIYSVCDKANPTFILFSIEWNKLIELFRILGVMVWVQMVDNLFFYFLLFVGDEMFTSSRVMVMIFFFFFSFLFLYPILYILLMFSLNDVLNYYHSDKKEEEEHLEIPIIDSDHIDDIKHYLHEYNKTNIGLSIFICVFIDFFLLMFKEVTNTVSFAYYCLLIIFPILIFIIIYGISIFKDKSLINMISNDQIKECIEIKKYVKSELEINGKKFVIIKARLGCINYSSYPYPYDGDLKNIAVRLLVYDDKRRKTILDVYEKSIKNNK